VQDIGGARVGGGRVGGSENRVLDLRNEKRYGVHFTVARPSLNI